MSGLKHINLISFESIIFVLVLILSSCDRELTELSQDESFLKFFGGYQKDSGYDVKVLSDGGYVITGSIMSENGDKNVVLIRTDKLGHELWKNKQFGGPYDDEGYSVEPLPDGGFAILGYVTDITAGGKRITNMYLIRTSPKGELIWEKSYGGISNEVGYNIKLTSDNGFILVGSTESYGNGGKDVWLVKTDAMGDTLWTRTHGGVNDDVGKCVIETSGGYVFTGYTRSFSEPGQAGTNVFLVKTNTLGKVIFPYTYGGTGDDYGESVTALPQGGYLLTGSSTHNQTGITKVLLINTEEQINQISWSKLYGEKGNYFGLSVKLTADNGYVITGRQELSSSNQNIFLLKTNHQGVQEYLNIFGGTGLQRAEAVDIVPDGGYIITGSNEYEGNSMITLIKTQADGSL